jgi:hypothetical protein
MVTPSVATASAVSPENDDDIDKSFGIDSDTKLNIINVSAIIVVTNPINFNNMI